MHQVNSIEEALALCRRSFVAVGVFSFFINILTLTPIFYMINVYDKAVSTGSFPTLYSLVVIAAFLFSVLATLEWVRSTVLVHIANRLDFILSPKLYQLCFESQSGLVTAERVGSQPLSDLNALRQFLGSQAATVLFDLPWIPLFLVLMFLFHPVLALVALVCMSIMACIAVANQRSTTSGITEANKQAAVIASQTQRNLRNAEVAAAMGMMSQLKGRWRERQNNMLATQSVANSKSAGYSALIRTLTMAMQSAAITTGAVLAMQQSISPGVMIAAALLLGKSLQPLQQAVSSWKSFVDARTQYRRLNDLLGVFSEESAKMPLPDVKGHIVFDGVTVVPPGGEVPAISGVHLDLPPGTTAMVIGPSAAGKSTLIRTLLGLWPTLHGKARIDGADSHRFDRDELGPQIGYLPQDIELFDGTVAENIARFGQIDSESIVQAGMDANIHDMVLGLPEGYDTNIDGQNGLLSPGQRQRIALARALYGRPKILVLDEPNSNLDESGDMALATAIRLMKKLGSTIVIVSHRNSILPLADHLVVMEAGRVKEQGPMEELVARAKQAKLGASQVARQRTSSPDSLPARNAEISGAK